MLIELYKLTHTQLAYKTMTEKLIEKIRKSKRSNSYEFNETILLVNKYLASYEYEKAFDTIKNFIKKGTKKYV